MTIVINWAKILDDKGQVDTFIMDFKKVKALDNPLINSIEVSLETLQMDCFFPMLHTKASNYKQSDIILGPTFVWSLFCVLCCYLCI